MPDLRNLIASQQVENSDLKSKILQIETDLKQLLPRNVFICEDENSIKLWENLLFDKISLDRTSFKIISSKGCANNAVETALLHLIKEKGDYKPKLFRQLDRDGFTVEQISFLENAKSKNSDYTKFRGYKVIFLPVNEIENFAVLTDDWFTEELLKEFKNNNKISDAFRQTTDSNLNSAQKLCKTDKEKELFRSKDPEMLKEARISLLKYFPGKEIKKIKKNFNCDKVLIEKRLEDLPQELKDYLSEIKDYFEKTDD